MKAEKQTLTTILQTMRGNDKVGRDRRNGSKETEVLSVISKDGKDCNDIST